VSMTVSGCLAGERDLAEETPECPRIWPRQA
jgi:hypothetical protein